MQLFTEALTLTALGSAVALALAAVAVAALKTVVPATVPRLHNVAVDWRVLAVTGGTTMLVALLVAALPIVHLRRPALAGSLKEGGRSAGSARTQRIRGVLVVSEIAMAVMLLIGAVLLIRTFAAMRSADPGFEPAGVATARVTLPASRYSQGSAAVDFVARAVERLRRHPGVHDAAAVNAPPLSARASQIGLQSTSPADAPRLLVDRIVATPGYLRTAGIRLTRGRDFTGADRDGAPLVAIVDDVVARAAFGGADAIGRTMNVERSATPVTVIGIVQQPHLYQLHVADRGQVYLPHAQAPVLAMSLLARTAGDPAAIGPGVRRIVQEIDPLQPVADIRTLRQVVDDRLSDRRLSIILLALFAGVAMLLSAVGIYGLMAYAVTQRMPEFGIRIALGAHAGDLQRLVLTRTATLAAAGIVLGGAGAYAASGWLAAQLYGVSATDVGTFASVSAVLLLVALAASYVPARRATRVDPIRALRSE
jgi:putative ABC transport system permease protein